MSVGIEIINAKQELIGVFNDNLDKLNTGSASYINDLRKDAILHFEKLGIPTKKNEDYRYTDLGPSFLKQYNFQLVEPKVSFDIDEIFKCDIPDVGTEEIILVNGWYHKNNNKPLEVLDNGVIIGSLYHAAIEYPEIVEKHYGKYADSSKDGLTALNTAFAQDGIFFYVPDGVVLEKPLQIINILLDEKNLLVQHRNLFIIGENSQASFVICDHTLCDKDFLTNSVTEIFAAKNSHFDVVKMQNEHNDSTQLSSTFINQEGQSCVSTNIISLHGGMIRNNIEVNMTDEGCENNSYGLYLADKSQHISNHTIIEHAAPNCLSNQKFKGVLDDNGSAAFNGKILVKKHAQKTQAYQRNNNILLTDEATMNTKPQLIIYADDVKCSHGATVGQLDEDALFYLRSRGIGERESRLLLMYAFAHEIISEIKVEPLRERVEDLVDRRLRGELSRCNKCEMHCEI